jgi:hypothetical protein
MSRAIRRPWTLGEHRELLRLKDEGLSRAQIAQKLGRTPSAVKHQLTDLAPTYVCRLCDLRKPAGEFAWAPSAATPPCRSCSPGPAPRLRKRPAPGRAQPPPHPPQGSTTAEHDAYLDMLAAQFDHTGRHWQIGTFQLPTEAMWRQRFTDNPETLGRIVRDVVLEAWWGDQAQLPHGRRPAVTLTGADLIRYVPAIAYDLLPAEWPDHRTTQVA